MIVIRYSDWRPRGRDELVASSGSQVLVNNRGEGVVAVLAKAVSVGVDSNVFVVAILRPGPAPPTLGWKHPFPIRAGSLPA